MVRPYLLRWIPCLRLCILLQALTACRLPEYKGSMLRGAFGYARKKMLCILQRWQVCESCHLRRPCYCTQIFETFIEKAPLRFLRGLITAPKPLVLESSDSRRHFGADSLLTFDQVLMGKVAKLLPFALQAGRSMAATGVGSQHHPFELQQVFWTPQDYVEDRVHSPPFRLLYMADSIPLWIRLRSKKRIPFPYQCKQLVPPQPMMI